MTISYQDRPSFWLSVKSALIHCNSCEDGVLKGIRILSNDQTRAFGNSLIPVETLD